MGEITRTSQHILKNLHDIESDKNVPDPVEFVGVLKKVQQILGSEGSYRPDDNNGKPGGILYLDNELPVILVPDLHARRDFFLALMKFEYSYGQNVAEGLLSNDIQVVCVGDGVHAEIRAVDRWREAYSEFAGGFKKHKHMDEEIAESFGLMRMVVDQKTRFPENFHFIKGNHENILNENGNGNFPFGKFAYEGQMVTDYTRIFLGDDFLKAYAEFEKSLPLFVIGENFLVSHAEPREFFNQESIINYRQNPDVVSGLTWTANEAAEPESVQKMLDAYIDGNGEYYFGGHRCIDGLYNVRASGQYVQFHNPHQFNLVYIKPGLGIDLERDIFQIDSGGNKIS